MKYEFQIQRGGVLVLKVWLDFVMFLYCFWYVLWIKNVGFSNTATVSGLPGAKTISLGG